MESKKLELSQKEEELAKSQQNFDQVQTDLTTVSCDAWLTCFNIKFKGILFCVS